MFWLRFLHGFSRLVQSPPTPSAQRGVRSVRVRHHIPSFRPALSVGRSFGGVANPFAMHFFAMWSHECSDATGKRKSQLISGSLGGFFPHASRSTFFRHSVRVLFKRKNASCLHAEMIFIKYCIIFTRRIWNANDFLPPKKRGDLGKSRRRSAVSPGRADAP